VVWNPVQAQFPAKEGGGKGLVHLAQTNHPRLECPETSAEAQRQQLLLKKDNHDWKPALAKSYQDPVSKSKSDVVVHIYNSSNSKGRSR
jgi:hypothetical protein